MLSILISKTLQKSPRNTTMIVLIMEAICKRCCVQVAPLLLGWLLASNVYAEEVVECLVVPHSKLTHVKLASRLRPFDYSKDAGISEMRRANFGHEIFPGTKLVIAARVFRDDNVGVDSATFKKITIEIENAAFGYGGQIVPLKSFFTFGGVGHIYKGWYRHAAKFVSTLQVVKQDEKLRLKMKVNFPSISANDLTTQTEIIDLDCELRELPQSELNAWQGKPGTNWGSFTPSKQRQ